MAKKDDWSRFEEMQEIEEDIRQAWDRLPKESIEQYDLFLRFLRQGPQAQSHEGSPYGGGYGARRHVVQVLAQMAVD